MDRKMQDTVNVAKLKGMRRDRQWSQQHLADVAGIALRTVQRLENGEPASQSSVMALAAAFDVSASSLIVNTGAERRRQRGQGIEHAVNVARMLLWIHGLVFGVGLLLWLAVHFLTSQSEAQYVIGLVLWSLILLFHGFLVAMGHMCLQLFETSSTAGT